MAVLRGARRDASRSVGLDEAYLDLTGLERPNAAGAARSRRRSRRHGPGAARSGSGPNKLVAKVASDADKPDGFLVAHRGGGARALRRPLSRPDPGHRAPRRPAARGRAASRRSAQLGGAAGRAAVGVVRRRGWARTSAALARFEDERPWRPTACASPSRARPHSTPTCAASAQLEPVLSAWPASCATTSSATGAAGARWASRCASTTSRPTPARARSTRPSSDARTRSGRWRASCCARSTRRGPCACSACGSRAGEAPSGSRRAARDDQLSLVALSLAGRPDRAGRAEAERLLRGGGQVPLAAADVRAAVDHRHGDRPAAVAERDPGAARQRLVGHAERARG